MTLQYEDLPKEIQESITEETETCKIIDGDACLDDIKRLQNILSDLAQKREEFADETQ